MMLCGGNCEAWNCGSEWISGGDMACGCEAAAEEVVVMATAGPPRAWCAVREPRPPLASPAMWRESLKTFSTEEAEEDDAACDVMTEWASVPCVLEACPPVGTMAPYCALKEGTGTGCMAGGAGGQAGGTGCRVALAAASRCAE